MESDRVESYLTKEVFDILKADDDGAESKFNEFIDSDIINKEKILYSLEFFPPKQVQQNEELYQRLQKLIVYKPKFISVTYGAGGSNQSNSLEAIKYIKKQNNNLEIVAHLTCLGKTESELLTVAQQFYDIGIRKVVALRGDRVDGQNYENVSEDKSTDKEYKLRYAYEFVQLLKKHFDFEIFVAAYPEKHIESISMEHDLKHLQHKFNSGAHNIITQFFFEPLIYLDYCSKLASSNIDVNLIPGILVFHNFKQTIAFSKKCGTTLPSWFYEVAEIGEGNPLFIRRIVTYIILKQCEILIRNKITEFHFFTLNHFKSLRKVLDVLYSN